MSSLYRPADFELPPVGQAALLSEVFDAALTQTLMQEVTSAAYKQLSPTQNRYMAIPYDTFIENAQDLGLEATVTCVQTLGQIITASGIRGLTRIGTQVETSKRLGKHRDPTKGLGLLIVGDQVTYMHGGGRFSDIQRTKQTATTGDVLALNNLTTYIFRPIHAVSNAHGPRVIFDFTLPQ